MPAPSPKRDASRVSTSNGEAAAGGSRADEEDDTDDSSFGCERTGRPRNANASLACVPYFDLTCGQ